MVQNVVISKPDLQYAHPGIITPTVMAANFKMGYIFNKKTGESDADAAQRGSYNKALGAPNASVDRRWPGGLPVFYSNYARFREDTPLLTNIADFGVNGGCYFVVARSLDTNIGVGSNDRGFVVGNYGGNTPKGHGFEFANWSNGQIRAVDYSATTGAVLTNTLATAAGALNKWRILYMEFGRASTVAPDQLVAIVNLTGDGTTPDPTDTIIVGGRLVGSQTVSIGGRVYDGTNYSDSITKDIAVVFGFNALPELNQRNAINNQLITICQSIGIPLGSV